MRRKEGKRRAAVEKVPVGRRVRGMVRGNMQSVYDRATCCRWSTFFPLSRAVEMWGGWRASQGGARLGSPLVILMYKSSNPNSRPTRSRNFQAALSSPFPSLSFCFSLHNPLLDPLSLFLSLFPVPSTALDSGESFSGIPRAFRINKASEARAPKALKHEKARSAGCFDFSYVTTDAFAFRQDVTRPI